jgi:hypothetical protein
VANFFYHLAISFQKIICQIFPFYKSPKVEKNLTNRHVSIDCSSTKPGYKKDSKINFYFHSRSTAKCG